jgi:hypothetical protein
MKESLIEKKPKEGPHPYSCPYYRRNYSLLRQDFNILTHLGNLSYKIVDQLINYVKYVSPVIK